MARHAPEDNEIGRLIAMLARIPGFGPRSARRAALHMIEHRQALLEPLIGALAAARDTVKTCSVCGNLDTSEPCAICVAGNRDDTQLCVVEDVADLWALERTRSYRGRYHVLGGVLSALDGIGPDELRMESLVRRVRQGGVDEVILALGATVDGQTTAHYITDRLAPYAERVTRLAHGMPVGGELDYLDDGTLTAALNARRSLKADR
ncbi:MAG: recombination mediator RecR [Alphaproteobacteria bacterium]